MNKYSRFQTIVLSYPNVENQSSTNDRNRFPLTGTIDEIGMDIQAIKDMEVDHILCGYNFIIIKNPPETFSVLRPIYVRLLPVVATQRTQG